MRLARTKIQNLEEQTILLIGQVSWVGMLGTNPDYLVLIEPPAITTADFPINENYIDGHDFLRFTAKEFCQKVKR